MSRQSGEGPSKKRRPVSDFCCLQQRYVIGIVCSVGAVVTFTARDCTTAVMNSLVAPDNISHTEQRSQCPKGPGEDIEQHFTGHYQWSDPLQKLVVLSFYIGYVITHVPVGMMSERYGAKWPYFSIVVASAIVTAATPIVIEKGEQWGLIGMNILLGITQGGMVPTLAVILARWYPPSEHSRFGALLNSSGIFGHAIIELIANPLLKSFHWSILYYSCAGLSVISCIFFVIFCYSTPDTHPFISEQEKEYLLSNELNITPLSELGPVPWKAMLSSLPVWAYVVMHVGHDWVLYGLLLNMPLYLHEVLRLTHLNVIIWSVVPVFVLFITAVSWGIFSDYLLIRGLMNLNDLRKMNTMIASFGTGLFLLFCSYARCHHFLAISFFILCMCTKGVFFSGAKLNSVDLCPNYAGTLMGISNGLGTLGAVTPSILNLVSKKSSLANWRNIFWLDFSVICSSAIIYLLFGSSKIQKWNFRERSDSLD